MWQLENKTPFAAERCFVRDKRGAEIWVVAVKATFHFTLDGTLRLAEPQTPVFREPRYRGAPGRSSLLWDADLVHTKASTDLLLQGHAYAPGGRAIPWLDVSLRAGPCAKSLRVYGDRSWQSSYGLLKPSAPEPFTRMPILYERALGGTQERRNPVGVGLALSRDDVEGLPAPNIEYPDWLMTSWKDRPPPAGFGPIDRSWSPRAELAGTYDGKWRSERAPLLPEDFDERFHQCAPADQQIPGHLKGGEPVTLRHLTAEREEVTLVLPRLWLGFQTFLGRDVIDHRANLLTVLFEPDELRFTMTWGTHLPCQNKEHKLERTRIFEKELLAL